MKGKTQKNSNRKLQRLPDSYSTQGLSIDIRHRTFQFTPTKPIGRHCTLHPDDWEDFFLEGLRQIKPEALPVLKRAVERAIAREQFYKAKETKTSHAGPR